MRRELIVAAIRGDGRIGLVQEEIPPTRQDSVLLEVKSSLVSSGTELSGWRRLAQRKPDSSQDVESPRTWTRLHRGARVFYTSLGSQSDFKEGSFLRMLANAVLWCGGRV